jgi:hypothetical protein
VEQGAVAGFLLLFVQLVVADEDLDTCAGVAGRLRLEGTAGLHAVTRQLGPSGAPTVHGQRRTGEGGEHEEWDGDLSDSLHARFIPLSPAGRNGFGRRYDGGART